MPEDVPSLDTFIRRHVIDVAASSIEAETDPEISDAMRQLLAGQGFERTTPLQDITVPAFHGLVRALGFYVHRQHGVLLEGGWYFLDTMFCCSNQSFQWELTLYGLVPSGRYEQLLGGMTPKGLSP